MIYSETRQFGFIISPAVNIVIPRSRLWGNWIPVIFASTQGAISPKCSIGRYDSINPQQAGIGSADKCRRRTPTNFIKNTNIIQLTPHCLTVGNEQIFPLRGSQSRLIKCALRGFAFSDRLAKRLAALGGLSYKIGCCVCAEGHTASGGARNKSMFASKIQS